MNRAEPSERATMGEIPFHDNASPSDVLAAAIKQNDAHLVLYACLSLGCDLAHDLIEEFGITGHRRCAQEWAAELTEISLAHQRQVVHKRTGVMPFPPESMN